MRRGLKDNEYIVKEIQISYLPTAKRGVREQWHPSVMMVLRGLRVEGGDPGG
jgi:hypothetical protein